MSIDADDLLESKAVIMPHPKRPQQTAATFRAFKRESLQLPKALPAVVHKGRCCNNASNAHYCAIEHAKMNNMPYILVFEADAAPCKSAMLKLRSVLQSVPADAGML